MNVSAPSSAQAVQNCTGHTSLEAGFRRASRKRRRNALLLATPLILFILVTFLLPIFDMLVRSADNAIVQETLPTTVPLLAEWQADDTNALPDETIFKAFVLDAHQATQNKLFNKLGKRLNYEKSGMSSLFRKTGRKLQKFDAAELAQLSSYKTQLLEMDQRWSNPEIWRLIQRESGQFTFSYYLAAVDAQSSDDGWQMKPEEQQVYLHLFLRTLWLSGLITFLTLLLGYPVAYLLATVETRTSNLLMVLVLLPFWTSLLARTSAWIALLQQEGVINDLLVGIGLLTDDGRLAMIHNQIGTVVTMTHILLPFMILPLFSVMKTIPRDYMRVARSLGATPFTAFRRVYLPNTIPGIGAGAILVFILAIGYYITPALVGGTEGSLISNFIAYHISNSLNWGLAAALGTLLLMLVLAIYLVYDKVIGVRHLGIH